MSKLNARNPMDIMYLLALATSLGSAKPGQDRFYLPSVLVLEM